MFSVVAVLGQIVQLFQAVLLLWVILSWFPDTHQTPFYRRLDEFFTMVLDPIRKVIPPIGGTLDISPIVLIVILNLLMNFVNYLPI